MKVQVTVKGGEELARKLHDLAERPRRKATLKGLRAGAEPIRDRAASLCPRSDAPGEAGHLADNIGIKNLRQGRDAQVDEEHSVGIGVPKRFFYDTFLEFGTHKMGAHPFYRPAFDGEAPAAIDICARTYWQELTT